MTLRTTIHLRVSYKWIAILLFAFAIQLLSATEARSEDRCVADLGGVLNGLVTPNPPSQIQIDGNCIIKNFPASNPLRTNFSFYTSPGTINERWLIIFDNVVFIGNMSCNSVLGHHIWFTNSSSSTLKEGCQNLFVPVEKIDKQNPPGPPTAAIGIPFTYKLTIPVYFDPATGSVINSNGSPNALHGITIWDDLDVNATGVDLSFVSERAYWLSGGAPVPHTFSNIGGALTFSNFPNVAAGQQFVIEITVYLRDTPTNVPGKQFVNTAKWQFGRLVDGLPYENLPGQWGISPPMTIAAPVLAVTKSGPATMNIGQWGNFALDVRNTGTIDAWDVTLRDQLPDGATGGMCDLTPEILSAQVFAADGVTPIPGKGPLTAGSGYSLNYSAAPACRLEMTILAAAGRIGPNERLIIRYRTQLDNNTQNGVTLTNVAGAIQWFNGDSSNSNRRASTRILTNGTPGVLDHEDAFTVTTALSGYFFEKTVVDITSGANPATTAAPGDKLRYTLRFRNTQALSNFRIFDELDAMNAQAAFAPGTLALVTIPAGADITATSSTGGTKGTGVIDVRNLSLPASGGEILIQFDITLKSPIAAGTVVSNQSTLRLANGTTFALSDDPNVNGTASPTVPNDEDPTRVTIVSAPAPLPAFRVQKISTDRTGDPNLLLADETLRYTITVKNIGNADAVNVVLRDAVPANTTYVAGSTTLNGATVADVAGVSPLVNGMRINPPGNTTPGSMPADASSNPANVATITFDVVVNHVAGGTVISNQGFVTAAESGIVDQPSDDPRTTAPNDPTINIVTAVNPAASGPVLVVTKAGPATMNLGQWGNFAIDVRNIVGSDAWDVALRDLLPRVATGGMCDLTPEILSAQVFAADGVTPIPGKGPLTAGSGYSVSYSAAPNCRLDITMTSAAAKIAANERLIIRYRTQLDANTLNGVALTNVAGAIQWFDADSSNASRQSYTRTLTNGTPGTVDHEDAFTVAVAISGTVFEKTVADITTGANPATTARPGDRLRYTLRFRANTQPLSNFGIVDELDALNPQAYFAPGTLTLVASPAGADISATSNTGGTKGTGLIDIRSLNVPIGGEAVIQFDIILNSSIANGAVVANQSTLRLLNGTTFALSDDPNVGGTADPTRVTIVSPTAGTPSFRVQKISTDMTGDPNVLLPAETLRYTITVKNVGNADAANVTLRDAVPANTTYVAGSTTLNGAAVADVAGVSPLVNGMRINSPANSTPGSMPADASNNSANVATITFDVVVNQVTGGTVISNQGFVTADGGIIDQPSDDPRTPAPNDPTLNTVGSIAGPMLLVTKSGPSTMNPGQWGNFAIDVRNNGSSDAWNANLRDLLPRGATGGMCDLAPEILSAQVFAADGVTPVAGKGPLTASSDYSRNYSVAPNCQLDITILTAAGRIGSNERLIIRYRTQLDANTQNGATLTNIAGATQWFDADSSNPNRKSSTRTLTNGTPGTLDHEDAYTVTVALPASTFLVQKISTDMTGDPNVLLPGETLRYAIAVKNISTTDAVNVTLRDAIPVNTTYVAGSTTLNGVPVADVGGVSPLVNGMPINSPANTTPGSMPADATSNPANVATITFDVVVNQNVAGGTAISNQGFVTAAGSGVVDQPSDDPRTPAPNDPTINIVGNRPRLYADKRVALSGDRGSPGIVDPGDGLRYTIAITNSAAIPATGVVLTDAVPANTTYVAGSTTLNGAAVADVGGGSPLASGITIGSSGQAAGTIAPGATAVLQYELRVNLGTPAGTQISNQAVVSSSGQPNLLTDGDGNPATGPEPTVVIVGAGQQVSITNQVSVVGGGAAVPGAQLDYVVTIVNTATVPAYNVVITDDVNAPQPGQLSYVNGSATMNGAASGVSFAGSTNTFNYGAVNGPLAPGAVVVLRFRATLNSNLVLGTLVTNTAVVTWNNPPETKSASVSLAVGSIPGPGVRVPAEINGSVWYDAGFDEIRDSGERALAGWAVELYRDNQLLQSVVTDANGVYRITDVQPNDVTLVRYELRFRAPGAGPNTAMLGRAASPFTNGLQRISDIIVPSGANLQGLNLPVHPNGVIYNTATRTPIAGATLTLLDRSASPLPATCLDDAAQQGQITLADGYYKFDVNFSNPACPSGGDYLIGVTAPAGMNYVAGYSQIIPPKSSASTAAFSVPACAGSAADAIPRTTMFCEVQTSEFAPGASVPPRSAGTNYHVNVKLDGSQMPGTSQIFNNHIPLDPVILGSLSISKTTPMLNVSRGQLVPYVITVNNRAGQLVPDVTIVDRLPAGFTYIVGSALLDGVPTEPSVVGRELSWSGLTVAGTQVRTVKLLIAVGAGVTEGEFANRAQAMNLVTGNPLSGEATATVRLVPDVTLDCNDVTGKVFNDANRNGRQDAGEDGLAGVRVVTAQGLQATTDQYGRYHITCAIVPNEIRGSNFVLKLDDRTLPSGFRMSTDQIQIERATRGKALRVNFGASIQRVVGIDLSDAAFEPGTTEIRVQWKPRLNLLLEELHKSPALLRLSYVADTEDEALVKRRVEAVKRQLTGAWVADKNSHGLTIEHEVFWRRGAPAKRPDVPGRK